MVITSFNRALAGLRWLRDKARRRLQRLRPRDQGKVDERSQSYIQLYQGLGDRALKCGKPGESMPELTLHDLEGNDQQLSHCWSQKPALLVSMSLSCVRSRKQIRALERMGLRFKESINTVVVYVVEAHPTDVPSPYMDQIWKPPMNEIAGIQCAQPRTLEERMALADQLRRRFSFSSSMLIDTLDNCAWRAFGSAPNVAILVRPNGEIAFKQGWFEPKEMAHAIEALLNSSVADSNRR